MQYKTFNNVKDIDRYGIHKGTTQMNIAELQKILAEHGVRSRAYSIEGSGDDEEQYRLEKDGLLWIFYYYERGNKVGVREFLTEDEACIYFLKILLDDSTTRR